MIGSETVEGLDLVVARLAPCDGEFELADTGVFDESRYFDVFVEYAKSSPDDIVIAVTVAWCERTL